MGLDMYLTADKSAWSHDEHFEGFDQAVRERYPEIPEKSGRGEVSYNLEVKVGYWRKANAIHRWFVENVQNGEDECQKTFVSRKQLEKLKATCEKVKGNHDLAGGLLPTQEGFFFGGTEYDEWYFEDIDLTIEICEEALKMPQGWYFYYRSSW